MKNDLMDDSENTAISLSELCEACHIPTTIIHEFIAYEIVRPKKLGQYEWIFNVSELKRIQTALRLQHDLEINLSGVALVLELLDELKIIKEKNKVLTEIFHHVRRENMEWSCEKCGMGVKGLKCAKCDAELVEDVVNTKTGNTVAVAKCPEGCGMIKSPMCCGQDMSCKI